jgi:hypothetical protein
MSVDASTRADTKSAGDGFARDAKGRFGQGNQGGPGRAGKPNKINAAVKQMLLTAVELRGRMQQADETWLAECVPEAFHDEIRALDGGSVYLLMQTFERPGDINQCLAKLMPREVAVEDETKTTLEVLLAHATQRARELGPEAAN